MLELSLGAAAYVDERRRDFDLPESAGLRIWPHPDQERRAMKMGFRTEPGDDDDVVEGFGARVFVANELADVLSDRVLDVDHDTEPARLVLRARAS